MCRRIVMLVVLLVAVSVILIATEETVAAKAGAARGFRRGGLDFPEKPRAPAGKRSRGGGGTPAAPDFLVPQHRGSSVTGTEGRNENRGSGGGGGKSSKPSNSRRDKDLPFYPLKLKKSAGERGSPPEVPGRGGGLSERASGKVSALNYGGRGRKHGAVPGSYIIIYRDDVPVQQRKDVANKIQNHLRGFSGKLKKKISLKHLQGVVVEFPDVFEASSGGDTSRGESTLEAVKSLIRAERRIKYFEPNQYVWAMPTIPFTDYHFSTHDLSCSLWPTLCATDTDTAAEEGGGGGGGQTTTTTPPSTTTTPATTSTTPATATTTPWTTTTPATTTTTPSTSTTTPWTTTTPTTTTTTPSTSTTTLWTTTTPTTTSTTPPTTTTTTPPTTTTTPFTTSATPPTTTTTPPTTTTTTPPTTTTTTPATTTTTPVSVTTLPAVGTLEEPAAGVAAPCDTAAGTVQSEARWTLDRINQEELPLDGRIPAEVASGDVSGDDAGLAPVWVYVLDSGLAAHHPEFRGRAVVGAVTCGTCGAGGGAEDREGHGTHVAGIIASHSYGAAKHARVVGVKVLDDNGQGTTADVIAAIQWSHQDATDKSRLAIINLSLGGGYSEALNAAVNDSYNAGVPVVVAAGNSDENACRLSPASSPYAITVACSDEQDSLCYGARQWDGAAQHYTATWASNYGECVNILAPGKNVPSVDHESEATPEIRSGTSMSAPLVSSVLATLLAQTGDMSRAVEELFLLTAEGQISDWYAAHGTLEDIGTTNTLLQYPPLLHQHCTAHPPGG